MMSHVYVLFFVVNILMAYISDPTLLLVAGFQKNESITYLPNDVHLTGSSSIYKMHVAT